YPGFHEPGGGLSFGMNKGWWDGLTKLEQQLITAACMEEHAAQYEETVANNGKFLARLVNDHGVEVKQFSDDIYDSFGEASNAVYEETRSHSELAKKIDDAFQAALREVGGWRKIAEVAFSTQRNRVLGI
ncbi:MAG: ABC transporter substrate-binding protein, partial [Pseudomonadota bacterium]